MTIEQFKVLEEGKNFIKVSASSKKEAMIGVRKLVNLKVNDHESRTLVKAKNGRPGIYDIFVMR